MKALLCTQHSSAAAAAAFNKQFKEKPPAHKLPFKNSVIVVNLSKIYIVEVQALGLLIFETIKSVNLKCFICFRQAKT